MCWRCKPSEKESHHTRRGFDLSFSFLPAPQGLCLSPACSSRRTIWPGPPTEALNLE